MLVELRIRDYAVVEDLTLELGPGLNVLTGAKPKCEVARIPTREYSIHQIGVIAQSFEEVICTVIKEVKRTQKLRPE